MPDPLLSPAILDADLQRPALVLLGGALLLAGRRLFWLAVAALGFLAGWWVVERWAASLPRESGLLVALLAGLLGVVVALVVQKAAVAVAGFLLGTLVLARLLPLVGLAPGGWQGLLLLAGGLLAAVLALRLFDLALSLLTAGVGAALLVEGLLPQARLAPLLLLAAWGAGAVVQLRREPRQPR